jgi:hypothetical protein
MCILASSDRESPGNRCERGYAAQDGRDGQQWCVSPVEAPAAQSAWSPLAGPAPADQLQLSLRRRRAPAEPTDRPDSRDHRLPGLRKNGQKRSLKRPAKITIEIS